MEENNSKKMTAREIFNQLYGRTDQTKSGCYDVCDDDDCYCE